MISLSNDDLSYRSLMTHRSHHYQESHALITNTYVTITDTDVKDMYNYYNLLQYN